MLVFILTIFPIIASLIIGLLCAYSDFNRLKIPNQYLLIVIGLFVFMQIAAFIFPDARDVLPSLFSALIAAAILFVLSAILFALHLMGAGDSKMMTVFGLFMGVANIGPFLFYMATSGAILGIATLLLGKYKPINKPKEGSWIFFAQSGDKTKVPYGIAILTGTVFSYAAAGFFDPQTYLSLFPR
jgi:prepilin peptidase CpaA|tara:strand:+ start:88851 stop:89405 length:555 start_codon:yes stop_codon:yes gene_type:complete